jgi:protein-S-isoprenylcysteine O-methyltransferase Ste14
MYVSAAGCSPRDLARIVVGRVAGVWIDRLRRKAVLVATNVACGLLFLAVAMAAAFGWLRMELLYGLGLVMAALGWCLRLRSWLTFRRS